MTPAAWGKLARLALVLLVIGAVVGVAWDRAEATVARWRGPSVSAQQEAATRALRKRIDSLTTANKALAEAATAAQEAASVAAFEAESARALARAARARVVIVHDSGVRVDADTTVIGLPPAVVAVIEAADARAEADSVALARAQDALAAKSAECASVGELLAAANERAVMAERARAAAERALAGAERRNRVERAIGAAVLVAAIIF
jgi:hypothetical protein